MATFNYKKTDDRRNKRYRAKLFIYLPTPRGHNVGEDNIYDLLRTAATKALGPERSYVKARVETSSYDSCTISLNVEASKPSALPGESAMTRHAEAIVPTLYEVMDTFNARVEETEILTKIDQQARHLVSHYRHIDVQKAKDLIQFDTRLAQLVAELDAASHEGFAITAKDIAQDGITYDSGQQVADHVTKVVVTRLGEKCNVNPTSRMPFQPDEF